MPRDALTHEFLDATAQCASLQEAVFVCPSVRPILLAANMAGGFEFLFKEKGLIKSRRHCGTRLGRFETSNHSLFHKLRSE